MAKTTKSKAKATPALEIPRGKYMVVESARKGGDLTTMHYRSTIKDVPDLTVRPWGGVVADPKWVDDPEFDRDVLDGRIVVRWSNSVPKAVRWDLQDDLASKLNPNEAEAVKVICQMPYSEQFRSIVRLDEHVSDNGVMRRDSRVTVEYLKGTHLFFLKALADLETRFQNRTDVLRDVRAALARIDKM